MKIQNTAEVFASGDKEREIELKKNTEEILVFYNREAHKLIHTFIDIHNLKDYQITPFAVQGISGLLMEWHYYEHNLPEEDWAKAVKMYMEIIEVDWDFLDGVYERMKCMH
jgi:hypothetical protein